MATLKQIRARIRAAKNIQQITKALKLVAAARLKKATDRVTESRPYADKLKEVIQSVGGSGDLPVHPLMVKRPIKTACLILLTSERGLAGPFNTILIRRASEFIRSAGYGVTLYTVGKKGFSFFSRRGYKIANNLTVPSSGATLDDATKVAQDTRAMFESGEVDAIFVCYAKFFSAIRQTPQVVQLLPIEPPEASASETKGANMDYAFEPSAEGLLNTLLPRYFFTLLWQAMLESTASEFGARMTAMTLATDSAGKMIQKLTLTANRERQAAITTEILEVVGGAEALKS
jgi:F-type H+-transporting ATPase subunit gamma